MKTDLLMHLLKDRFTNQRIFLFLFLWCFVLQAQQYDLLIKGGYVIDPKNNLDSIMDVAVADGKIAKVTTAISENEAKLVVNAVGLYVCPGLIDIHSHNFHGTEADAYLSNSYESVPPDGFTFRVGVTTIVDAGGAGWRNFEQFKTQTIDRSKTRVLAFLNIVGQGMKGGAIEQNIEDMDPEKTAQLAMQYPKQVVGIKLAHFEGYNWVPTDKAVDAGRLANIPVMIDFGRSDPVLPIKTLFLEKLRPGDIFTHTYAHVSRRMPLTDEHGKVHDFVFTAQQKGILFDVGHGGGSFDFEQAIPAMKQGLRPNTISTDLHINSMNAGMKDLLNVMSKFLNLGMSVKEVIQCTTWNSGQAIKRTDLGHLSQGAVADITLLNLKKGKFGFIDTKGLKMQGNQKLECELTIREGKVVWDLNGLSKPLWDQQKKD